MTIEPRAARPAFLGIERSLTGRRWAARLADERIALAIGQRHGLPDAICRLLAAREVDLEGVPDPGAEAVAAAFEAAAGADV